MTQPIIEFSKPTKSLESDNYVIECLGSAKLSGPGRFAAQCENYFKNEFGVKDALMVPSCTAALEMSALLLNIKDGDEVIVPSYTFVSTANAFAIFGAKVIFCDIEENTLGMCPESLKKLITSRTKVIVPVHYAGVICKIDEILKISSDYGLAVVEDAAQAIGSTSNGMHAGCFGDLGAISFHDTKNITSGGEGGVLLINNPELCARASIIREKGTNRKAFIQGAVDKYTWVDYGSSYIPSELQMAYLLGSLECLNEINARRKSVWLYYHDMLAPIVDKLNATIPSKCNIEKGNGHIFYVVFDSRIFRDKFLQFMRSKGVQVSTHYVSLHSSPMGMKLGETRSPLTVTDIVSQSIVRLPIYDTITKEELQYVEYCLGEYVSTECD